MDISQKALRRTFALGALGLYAFGFGATLGSRTHDYIRTIGDYKVNRSYEINNVALTDDDYINLGNFTFSTSAAFESDNTLVGIVDYHQTRGASSYINYIRQANIFSYEVDAVLNRSLFAYSNTLYDFVCIESHVNLYGFNHYYFLDFYLLTNNGTGSIIDDYSLFKIDINFESADFTADSNGIYYRLYNTYDSYNYSAFYTIGNSNTLNLQGDMQRILVDNTNYSSSRLFFKRFVIGHASLSTADTINHFDYVLKGALHSDEYNDAYDTGYTNGYNDGYIDGNNDGYTYGYQDGKDYVLGHADEFDLYDYNSYIAYGQSRYNAGLADGANVLSMSGVMNSIFTAPISMFMQIFNSGAFRWTMPTGEVLDLGGLMTFFLTIGIALAIVRLIMKVGGK